MATASPYGNPNWLKRQNRLNTPRASKPMDLNDPRQAAQSMYGAGLQMGADGSPKPTRDFGSLLRLNSSQMNSLSRGAKPGSFSSLGQPMNSMYANNPGFFNKQSGSDFASKIGQRNQTLAPGAPVPAPTQRTAPMDPDTPGGASALARSRMMNRPVDNALTEKRGFGSPQTIQGAASAPAPASQAISTQATNRAGLEDRASGLRLLREMSQTPLQIDRKAGGGNDMLVQGKYGSGFSYTAPAGVKRPAGMEGDIGTSGSMRGTRPFSEVMQGLANKQVNEGTWSEGDRLPQGMTAEQAYKTNEEARQKILSRQRIAAKTK